MTSLTNGNSVPTEIDVTSIEQRYKEEREKRMTKKGISQFREAVGTLAKFGVDLNANTDGSRPPVDEDVDVFIVGCGFGGLLAARRLHEAGITDIRMVDKAADFGGVWYWNRYPGLYCDTEAYIYLPLLEETGYLPSGNYVPGYEIHEHALRIAEQEKLRQHALFQTEATTMKWSDELGRWIVETTRGDQIRARFVISAIGILHKLHLPGIPGIENFRGQSFHSSRWDYSITGGDRYGAPLDKLRGKKVALIGTGASTVQALPHLTASGAEVYVFQRTPSGVQGREIKATDKDWFSLLGHGWQTERITNFDSVFSGGDVDVDLVNDGWTELAWAVRTLKGVNGNSTDPVALNKEVEMRKMDSIRVGVERQVKDKRVAEQLKPWYGRNCKRPCFHSEYLPCFNEPNVHLVNTDGKGVEGINVRGVIANGGVEYPVDCIIYATGFDWANDYSQRANMVITGRQGLTLAEKWSNGPSTLHGMMSRDFPNYLIFTHLQSSPSPNYTGILNERAKHAAYIVSEALRRGLRTIEPTQEAEDEWVARLEKIAVRYLDYFQACTPGYLNAEGQISSKNLRNASVGLSAPVWNQEMKQWRDRGKLDGMELDR